MLGTAETCMVKLGYRTLEFSEVLAGLKEGDHVAVSEQDKLKSGRFVRQRLVRGLPPPNPQ